jgi:hypothetical protein
MVQTLNEKMRRSSLLLSIEHGFNTGLVEESTIYPWCEQDNLIIDKYQGKLSKKQGTRLL